MLASFALPPQEGKDFLIWSQAHAFHHYDCIRVAGSQLNKTGFQQWVLDPFNPKSVDWLEQHYNMHAQMNAALGITNQFALSDLDWNDPQQLQDWANQNFAEHQKWSTMLGIG